MKKQTLKRAVSLAMASTMILSLAACGSGGDDKGGSSSGEAVPTIDQITVGEDYKDIKADIKVLTNRTDIVDTVYAGYAEEFMKLYPNINVEYEAVTDYEESLTLRLTTGDWGDLCFIPTSVDKSELGDYFVPLGDFDTLDPIYNFCTEKTYDGTIYGIANGGTANGVVYNRRYGLTRESQSFRRHRMNSWTICRLSRKRQTQSRCILISRQDGQWERGMHTSESLRQEIRIS